ncbi:serine hydrolase [Salinicola halophilus]|uniref:serine hydrolase n=1 Tax=Salinicola halophilus TaxID=184065 RepID=UPI0013A619F5|nr:serine hydrolase [Salinicola halophilus]
MLPAGFLPAGFRRAALTPLLAGALVVSAHAQDLQDDIAATPIPTWPDRLTAEVARIDAEYPGEIGVYVQDLDDDTRFAYRADQPWYLASMIKVPVALALMREVDAGNLTLDDTMTLRQSDYVDGAGETNWHGVGETLSLRWLLEQMITRSDNTATDMLIRRVGVETVNDNLDRLIGPGIGTITTLADVRRHAYAEFHPNAFDLDGLEFLDIRKATREPARLAAISRFIGVPVSDFQARDLSQAFDRYYETGLNAGRLDSVGRLLAMIERGETLSPASTQTLLAVMERTRTGANRLRRSWPDDVDFAHKTGTQRSRFCDGGIASRDTAEGVRRVVVVTCAKGTLSMAPAERAMRDVGAAVWETGLLN